MADSLFQRRLAEMPSADQSAFQKTWDQLAEAHPKAIPRKKSHFSHPLMSAEEVPLPAAR
mgnify:FL=1